MNWQEHMAKNGLKFTLILHTFTRITQYITKVKEHANIAYLNLYKEKIDYGQR